MRTSSVFFGNPVARFNLFPFVFLPGVALVGYAIGGLHDAMVGCVLWAVVVLVGTAVALIRQAIERIKAASADSKPASPMAKAPPP